MSEYFKFYKRRFKNALRPILVMLVDKRKTLSERSWKQHVQKIVKSIVNNPGEYLGQDLPNYSLTCDIVYDIFEQFFKMNSNLDLTEFQPIANEILKAKHDGIDNRQKVPA